MQKQKYNKNDNVYDIVTKNTQNIDILFNGLNDIPTIPVATDGGILIPLNEIKTPLITDQRVKELISGGGITPTFKDGTPLNSVNTPYDKTQTYSKQEVYTKVETYQKSEIYNKTEIDAQNKVLTDKIKKNTSPFKESNGSVTPKSGVSLIDFDKVDQFLSKTVDFNTALRNQVINKEMLGHQWYTAFEPDTVFNGHGMYAGNLDVDLSKAANTRILIAKISSDTGEIFEQGTCSFENSKFDTNWTCEITNPVGSGGGKIVRTFEGPMTNTYIGEVSQDSRIEYKTDNTITVEKTKDKAQWKILKVSVLRKLY